MAAFRLTPEERQAVAAFKPSEPARRLVFGVDDPPTELGIVPGYGTLEQMRAGRAEGTSDKYLAQARLFPQRGIGESK